MGSQWRSRGDDEVTAAEEVQVWRSIGGLIAVFVVTTFCCWKWGIPPVLGPGGTLRVAVLATLATLLVGLLLMLHPSVLSVPFSVCAVVALTIDGLWNGSEAMVDEVHGLAVVLVWASAALCLHAVVMLAVDRRAVARPVLGVLTTRLVLRILRAGTFFGAGQLVLSATAEASSRPWVLMVCCVVVVGLPLAAFPLLVRPVEEWEPEQDHRENQRKFAIDHDCNDHHGTTGTAL